MSHIYHSLELQKRIEKHSHYINCLRGEDYTKFCTKREQLGKYQNIYEQMKNSKEDLINLNYEYKNKIQQYNNLEHASNIKYENDRKSFEEEERLLALNNQNKIQEIIKQNELNKIQINNKINSLNEEINNIKVLIDNLKTQNDMDIDYKKKTILNKIKNDYKLKLVKYQNEKEKEKTRAMALYEIKKKNFEVQKEVEINKMKNISLVVQEIIAILKTTSLNN